MGRAIFFVKINIKSFLLFCNRLRYLSISKTEIDMKTTKVRFSELDNAPAIAIVLGVDDEGNFVSVNVWASESRQIFSSYDLNSAEAKKWLSKINVVEGKRYYSLID